MKRLIQIFFITVLTTLTGAGFCFADADALKKVRIGAFNFYPCIFQGKDGSVQGMYVDFLNEIAKREGWQIEYVYGNWADGLERIKKREVDLLTSVAWTEERASYLDYAKVPLVTVWGELYTAQNSSIDSIREVEGKVVGVMKNDFNGATFRNMVQKFSVPCRFVEYGNFEEIFRAVASKEIDAGVVNSTFGAAKSSQYQLRSSGVIFNPFDIFFATAKGEDEAFLATLDKYLTKWRADNGSPYHKARQRWAHSTPVVQVLPAWLVPALVALTAASAAAAIFIVLLRVQVRRNTYQITAQAAERRKIEETLLFINESGSRNRGDDLLSTITAHLAASLEVEFAFVAQPLPGNRRARARAVYAREGNYPVFEYDLEGTPCAEVLGKSTCIYPENVVQLFPEDRLLVEMQADGYGAVPLWDSQGNGIGLLAVISNKPLQNTPLVETMLQIVSSRVAQELEAMNYLEALKLKNFTIENSRDAVYWITPEGRILDVNRAGSEMLGYPPEELVSMSVTDIDCRLSVAEWRAYWEELKEKGNLQVETFHRTAGGREIPVEISANYCTYNGIECNLSVVRDISERKRMELALEHRLAVLTEPLVNVGELRFEDLFDLDELQKIQDAFAAATGVASIITDVTGNPVTRPSNFSRLCSEIIHKTEKGMANCRLSDSKLGILNPGGPVLQPCLSAGLWDGCAGIYVGGRQIGNWLIGQVLSDSCDLTAMTAYAREIGADEKEYRQALEEVTRMPVERFQKICDALFHITGQLSKMAMQNVRQAQHISEQQRSEELLLEYRKVIECSLDMVCVIDDSYRYLLANEAFLKARDASLDAVVGRTVAEVVGEQMFATIKPRIDECFTGKSVSFEAEFEYPDKKPRWLAFSYTPIEDTRGRLRLACVIKDYTEKKQLEEQLRQSQKMEAVGLLAGGIAHDFNNILTVIVGYGTMLSMDSGLGEGQKERVQAVISAAERAALLTQGLLAFSRKQVLAPQNVNLNEIVRHTEMFLLRVIGEDIKLKVTSHHPVLNVFADRGQIDQVIINLATNARDAMPQGGVLSIETGLQTFDEAYAHAHGYGEPGRYACLIVSDTGKGMSRETRERIFEPFFTTKSVGKGTGLGMAIVYGIVKQHKGFINVYSELGEGTTFKIYLPLAKTGEGAMEEIVAREPLTGGGETILVAEDDPDVRKLVQFVLSKFGYSVVLAVDGKDCVEKFTANRDRVDLVLLDMIMPVKNGVDAFKEIKNMKSDARVVYSSGYTADFIENRGVLDEGFDLIMKPVEPEKLLRKIREVLDRPSVPVAG